MEGDVASPRIVLGYTCPARAGELRPGRPGLYNPLYYESILQKKNLQHKKRWRLQ